MRHGQKRRRLSVAILAGTALAAGCSASGSTGTTGSTGATTLTDPDVAVLSAATGGVVVNGVDVPSGGSRPVQLDEQVVVGDKAQASLRVGDLEFLLLQTTDMRLVSWARPIVGSWLESGQIRVALDEDEEARLRLETSTKVVLTTRQPGTEFLACQTPPDAVPPATCLFVYKGEVEWEAKGNSRTFRSGEGTFALNGDPAEPAHCPSLQAFDTWFQAALRNEADTDLGGLVGAAPACGGATSESTTTATASTATIATTPTTPGGARPSTTAPRPRPPAPTTATTPDTPPPPTQPTAPTTQATTTQAPPPDTTPPTLPPVDTTAPPVVTTAGPPPT